MHTADDAPLFPADSADEAPSATVVERTYEQVKAMAVSFLFAPGDRLNELALSRRIGVSRTPLREALHRLAAEGFLTFSHRLGFFQNKLTERSVGDLFELRAHVALAIVRILVARPPAEGVGEVEALVRGAQGLDALEFDERFHAALATLTGNEELVEILKKLTERTRFIRGIDLEGRADQVRAQSRAILDALARADARGAEQAICDNLWTPPDRITLALKEAFARIYLNLQDNGPAG